MPRLMANAEFRIEQERRKYEQHIEPINRMVDELREDERGWLPYVAPMYGGVKARLLSVLRDPGPKTQDGKGSGFLCMENDDATAEYLSRLFAQSMIGADDIVPWNVYPWYINRSPKAAELEAGVEPMKRLIDLLPSLKVVVLHGGSAHDGWKRLTRRYPKLIATRGLRVIETYHTSSQAFFHPDPQERARRKQHLDDSFKLASEYLAVAELS